MAIVDSQSVLTFKVGELRGKTPARRLAVTSGISPSIPREGSGPSPCRAPHGKITKGYTSSWPDYGTQPILAALMISFGMVMLKMRRNGPP